MIRMIGGRIRDTFLSNIPMIGVILVVVSLTIALNFGYHSTDSPKQLWAPSVDTLYEIRVDAPTLHAHLEDHYLYNATLIANREEIEWMRHVEPALQNWWGDLVWGEGSGHLAMDKVYITTAHELNKLDFQIVGVEMIDQKGSRGKVQYPEELTPSTLSIYGWKYVQVPVDSDYGVQSRRRMPSETDEGFQLGKDCDGTYLTGRIYILESLCCNDKGTVIKGKQKMSSRWCTEEENKKQREREREEQIQAEAAARGGEEEEERIARERIAAHRKVEEDDPK